MAGIPRGETVPGMMAAFEMQRRMTEAAEAANERIRTCHERVACPKCGAPVGTKCRAMPRGYRPLDLGDRAARELKSPHRQRWTLVQPAR